MKADYTPNRAQTDGANVLKFNGETLTAAIMKPRYEVKTDGVYYIGIATDKQGNTSEKPPVKLSGHIKLIGAADKGGESYRIYQYKNRYGHTQTAALPMAEIGASECWKRLQGRGIYISASRLNKERLSEYLQLNGSFEEWTVTDMAGWINGAYILPSGEILSKEQHPKIIYTGDTSTAAAYQVKGDLKSWQTNVARYAENNSRLALAIGTALAAPFLGLFKMESGGFHLYGNSRDGKTTAGKIGLSVWGDFETAKLSWKATALGLDNVAAARNHNFLMLDEIGQANAKQVANAAYSIFNEAGKIQGAKLGGNKAILYWKTLVFSTGEKTLEQYLTRKGEDWNAGQAARLPVLPSSPNKGLGVLDDLHGFSDTNALLTHFNEAAAEHYGAAGRALIKQIQEQPEIIEQAKAHQNAFMAGFDKLDGQAYTVARRFALVAGVLEAARHITGWKEGAGANSIKQCFNAWQAATGGGNFEARKIIEQAESWIQQHADTMRFSDWNEDHTNHHHAGYRRATADNTEYWIIPAIYTAEIAAPFDPINVCQTLHGIGWQKKPSSGKGWQHQKAKKGRYYVLIGMQPPESEAGNE